VSTTVEQNAVAATPVQTRPILIVEDNLSAAEALRRHFSHRGYQPTICHTGRSALAHVESAPTPLACICDIHLPDLSGLILIQRLRDRLGTTVPIVVLSGDVSMATINSLPHVGATYFFPKPVNAKMLFDQLEQLLAA
jgi:two-component system sensor histidine kinase RpfC